MSNPICVSRHPRDNGDASASNGGDLSTASVHLARLAADLAARPYARRGVPTSNDRIRIMLVDDHAMVREGLRVLLRPAPDITVVGEAENGVEAVAMARWRWRSGSWEKSFPRSRS